MSFQTLYSGQRFYPPYLKPEDVNLRDICRSLSMQCRFGGHVKRFLSVAEHSVLVSNLAKIHNESDYVVLACLVHDFAEAYVTDIPKPVKDVMPQFSAVEKMVEAVVLKQLGFAPEFFPHEKIQGYDWLALHVEASQVMKNPPVDWLMDLSTTKAKDIKINCWSPEDAERVLSGHLTDWGYEVPA